MPVFDSILEFFRERYERGDRQALLNAIEIVLTYRLEAPVWVSEQFSRALAEYISFRAATFDDALGLARPKGKRLDAMRREAESAVKVAVRIAELSASGAPIGAKTVNAVAAEFKIGRTLAWEFWAKHQAFAEYAVREKREIEEAESSAFEKQLRRSEPDARERVALMEQRKAEMAKRRKPRAS